MKSTKVINPQNLKERISITEQSVKILNELIAKNAPSVIELFKQFEDEKIFTISGNPVSKVKKILIENNLAKDHENTYPKGTFTTYFEDHREEILINGVLYISSWKISKNSQYSIWIDFSVRPNWLEERRFKQHFNNDYQNNHYDYTHSICLGQLSNNNLQNVDNWDKKRNISLIDTDKQIRAIEKAKKLEKQFEEAKKKIFSPIRKRHNLQ
jgi:hypothetical protein